MANNRSTVRDYGASRPVEYLDHATQAVSVIHTYNYDSFAEYERDADVVWRTVDALRQNAPNTRSGGAGSFMVIMSFPEVSPRDVVMASREQASKIVRQLIYDAGGDVRDAMESVFSGGGGELSFSIVKVRPRVRGPNPVYRAPGRVWGYIGNKLLNCVTKEMMDMVTYYTREGEKRKYMWEPETGLPFSTDPLAIDYVPESMRKLAQDKSYRTIKKGIEEYMHKRGVKPYEDFGFEPRDLCDLARLCKCRIVVWIESGQFRVCRHDTDDLVDFAGRGDERYIFNFHMMSDQHLEILPMECLTSSEERSLVSQRINPGRYDDVHYLNDAGYEDILRMEGAKPENERRLYTLVKSIGEVAKLTCKFPEEALGKKYSGWILTSGSRVYKHESLREWTEGLVDNGVMDKSRAAFAVSLADVHSHKLRELYMQHNMFPVLQSSKPRLYNAVRWADMQFGHVQLPMEPGSDMYEYDGRKWYLADFSKMSCEEFPYFHGIPCSNSWSEYEGRFKDVVYVHGDGFKERVTMIGNAPGDRTFTFQRGTKYAIFQIEELDLSGVDANLRAHFERDHIFADFDAVNNVMILPSPIVHFLQDRGAVWRASRVWVCYGCGAHWIPECDSGSRLREDMADFKTYPVVLGRLMCGRNPVQNVTYIAPDPDTAASLQYFYSIQFAHGRLENEHRTSHEVILEGEEHEYDDGHNRARSDTDPDMIIYSDTGDFVGTSEPAYSVVRNGGFIVPTVKADEWDGKCPFFVETFQSTYNWGRTYAHISGAQHAMCFVRLYQAVSRVECSKVVGFSLDSFRTSEDVTHLVEDMIGDLPGYFKPVDVKPYKCTVNRAGSMLSDLYTPRSYFTGINKPGNDDPVWNAYKDSLSQFNIVTGEAGSGKTTRHFKKFGAGPQDYRLPENTVYVTMTNHLAHHVKSDMGVVSYTSFKGFNRRVNDDDDYVNPSERFSWKANNRSKTIRSNSGDVHKLEGVHTVLLDEVSMIDPAKITDIIEVCRSYHVCLVIAGDLDRERFYQLSPVGHTERDFFSVIDNARSSMGVEFNWVPPMRVFRQTGDKELSDLLSDLRTKDGHAAWKTLYESPIIKHVTYAEMLERFDASKDIVAQPWHRIICRVTEDVLNRMGPDDELKLRGNFTTPKKLTDLSHPVLNRMKINEADSTVFKGSTCLVTKQELESLRGTALMSKWFPYAGSSALSNEVNPMIGATVFNLQGLTLDDDAVLYIHTEASGFAEWVDDTQPKLAYVAASRARRRDQIVIVTGAGSGGRKRRRA